jgi:chlorobactene glucosyltransferase
MQNELLVTGIAILLSILCVMFLILLINLCTFRRIHKIPLAQSYTPFLSILVPARNEEQCIADCISSLIAQDYAQLEILVLDDQSTDATATIIEGISTKLPAEQQGRLRLLRGEELPRGWIGKNFACHQLAQQANGSYLLFTDADTIHQPSMARAVISCMQQQNVQLLTAQPAHIMESPGERLIVPLLNFTILTLLPVALILKRPEPSLATGNGQLLCFERRAYAKIGGHASVKEHILEDVLLARKIKAAKLRMIFVDAQELVYCRMYRSLTDVWNGFSKNLFALYNYSLPFAIFALILNLALFVLPLALVLSAPFTGLSLTILCLAIFAYLLPVMMRMVLTLRFMHAQRGGMLLLCLLHPLSILMECFILLNAIRWHYGKVGTRWKGRYYT